MPQLVEVPGVGTIEFPDDVTREEMNQALRRQFPPEEPPPAPPAEPLPETSALEAGLLSFGTGILPSFGAAGGGRLGMAGGGAIGGVPGAVIGGFAGALGGATAVDLAQQQALEAASPKFKAYQQAAAEQHPWATGLGSLLSGGAAFRFAPLRGISGLPALIRGTATEAERKAAIGLGATTGLGAAAGVVSPMIHGQMPTTESVAGGLGFSLLYGHPRTLLGSRMAAIARAKRAGLTEAAAEAEKGATTDASRIEKTTAVHGDLRTPAVKGAEEVSTQKRGPGVQPGQISQEEQTRLLLSNRPAVKLMPTEEGQPPQYEEAQQNPDGTWETHDEIIARAGLRTEDIDRRVFLDEKGMEKSREQTATELTGVGVATKVPGEAHSTDVNKVVIQRPTGTITIEANKPLPKEVTQHVDPEVAAYLDAERKAIDDPIDIVPDVSAAGDPFARHGLGQFMGINRQTGSIEIYPGELMKWLRYEVPKARWRRAIAGRLNEEALHLRTPPDLAERYWQLLSGIEKYFEQRIYLGRDWRARMALGDIGPTELGYEAVRRRLQRLQRLSTSEAAEAALGERWTVQSLQVLNDVVRGMRESLGTRASAEQAAMIGKLMENLRVATSAAGGRPAGYSKERGTPEMFLPAVKPGEQVERAGFPLPTGTAVRVLAQAHFADLTKLPTFKDFSDVIAGRFGSMNKEALYYAWLDAMNARLMGAKGADIEALMDRLNLRPEVAKALKPGEAAPRLARGKIPDPLELPAEQMSLGEIQKFFQQRQWKTKAAYRQKFGPEQRTRYAAIGEIVNKLTEQAGPPPAKPGTQRTIGPEDVSHVAQVVRGAERTIDPQTGLETLSPPDIETAPMWTALRPEDIADPVLLGQYAVRGARVKGQKATITNNVMVVRGRDGKVYVLSVFEDSRTGPKVTNPEGAGMSARNIDARFTQEYRPMVVAHLREPVEGLRQVFPDEVSFNRHFGDIGIEGTAGIRSSYFAGPQAGTARAQAGTAGAAAPPPAEAGLPPSLTQPEFVSPTARELTLPRFARRGVPAAAAPPPAPRPEPSRMLTPEEQAFVAAEAAKEFPPRWTSTLYRQLAERQVPKEKYKMGPGGYSKLTTEQQLAARRLYYRRYNQLAREQKYEERKRALEAAETLGGPTGYTRRRKGLLTDVPREGARELEQARTREDWQVWEYGLAFDPKLDSLIRRQLFKWGLRDAAGNDVLVEDAKAFVIHDRLGKWAMQLNETGAIPEVSGRDVWHSLNNYLSQPAGKFRLHLQRIGPAEIEEGFVPQRGEVSEEFISRIKLSVDPAELAARADTNKVLANFAKSLRPEERALLNVYLTTDGWTPERVKSIAAWHTETGLGPAGFKRMRNSLRAKIAADPAVTELLDAFRQQQRDIHDNAVAKIQQAEPAQPAARGPGALRRVSEEFELTRRDIQQMIKAAPTRNRITAGLDSAENTANNIALQRENEARFASAQRPTTWRGKLAQTWQRGKAEVLAAANVLIESQYDPLRAMWRGIAMRQGTAVGDFDPRAIPMFRHQIERGRLRALRHLTDPNPSLRRLGRAELRAYEQFKAELDYAERHWNDPDLQETARRLRDSYHEQLVELRNKGINVNQHPGFDPHRYDAAIWNGHSYLFNMANGVKRILGERTLAQRTFDSYYHAFGTDAFLPVTRDSASLLGHYMRKTGKLMQREAWREGLKAMRTPEGLEVAADPRVVGKARLPHRQGYELVSDGYTAMSVHQDYARLINQLVSPSHIEMIGPARAALHLSQILKHSILVGDFFHLGRMFYYGLAMMGSKAGFKSGWSVLDIAERNIPEALAKGIVRPKDVAWANARIALPRGRSMTRRQIVEKFYQEMGANLGRVQDALYKELVTKLTPLSGPTRRGIVRVLDPSVGRYNRFLFDRLTRGMMAESVAREFERQMKANPNTSPKSLMRDIAKDVNNFFGNIGRQGWFKSRTMQDLSRILFLAPQWVEGLIKKETIGPGRMLGITSALGLRQGPTALGSTGLAIGRGMLLMLGLTQALNLIFRRQPTWKNEEPEHKFDAWLPGWGGDEKGFWLSPLAIFNEVSHDIYRLIMTKPTVADALTQIIGNKEQPVTRAVLVGLTGQSPLGQKITTTGGRVREMGKAVLPVPISFGKLGQFVAHEAAPGLVSPPPRGSVMRQLFATGGIKIEPAQTGVQQVAVLAREFMEREGLTKQTGWQEIQTDQPGYTKLRAAIRNDDDKSARRNLGELRKTRTDKQIFTAMKQWAKRGFTGSQRTERQFITSLTDKELDLYNRAVEEKQLQFEKFVDWFAKQP